MFVRTYTGMKLFTEFRSCVKVQLAVLGSPSLIVPTVSVDVKQQWTWTHCHHRVQELCESRSGRPGLPVLNSPYCLRICVKVEVAFLGSLSLTVRTFCVDVKQYWSYRVEDLCESRGGRPGLPVPDSACGLCGRKATFEEGGQKGSKVTYSNLNPFHGRKATVGILSDLVTGTLFSMAARLQPVSIVT